MDNVKSRPPWLWIPLCQLEAWTQSQTVTAAPKPGSARVVGTFSLVGCRSQLHEFCKFGQEHSKARSVTGQTRTWWGFLISSPHSVDLGWVLLHRERQQERHLSSRCTTSSESHLCTHILYSQNIKIHQQPRTILDSSKTIKLWWRCWNRTG